MGGVLRLAQLRIIALVGALAVMLAAGWAVAGRWPGGQAPGAQASSENIEKTGKTRKSAIIRKATGLPLPRFVSLKNSKTNVRRGPDRSYPIAWEFNRRGLPVEIIREYENWRQIGRASCRERV